MATTLAGSKPNRKVLEPDAWDLWMKGDPDAAASLMKPAKEDALTERTVNKAVGNVKNNGPELLA
jgi:putative SOS response-associated peptidase YedK